MGDSGRDTLLKGPNISSNILDWRDKHTNCEDIRERLQLAANSILRALVETDDCQGELQLLLSNEVSQKIRTQIADNNLIGIDALKILSKANSFIMHSKFYHPLYPMKMNFNSYIEKLLEQESKLQESIEIVRTLRKP